ncbi:S-layer homology domain-containing protein [Clostridium tagluense]|uniref:S-layer homology domain-containing protein n=1 Tax=Clostridium tagluense TaxID=360422 RepID=UPI001CF44408|nr:S-layer homology domain-containing protein [Clostridium tagluense]MCB2312051.1 S-layer homology domain-containing protein [Clostridium tagluense]MCB2316638.1 S-layer homology domain-containing protein [Clostridium tagluense]MCB2321426.1 S-layer homology domain-containing protein [Clostridium tagluense]MCB2326438.1 S-layer homology domain-containing protein [Clostridium tagluense]MCB2331230.1 S-layer homology domain-containing protein [Clostridium tagluense]
MKFRKSTLSILLILTLLISTISSSFAFAADTLDYVGSVSRMKQLGIIDSSVTTVTKVMTRGQFVKAVVIADNLLDEASGMEGATVFPDVVSYSDLSGYISVLIDKQLISGMADGKFHPEASITYSEICTVLVKLLGYTDSDLTGTWPANYLGKAQNLKITDKLVLKKSDKVTFRDAAVMFDRLLDTKIKSASTTGTTSTTATATEVIFSNSVSLYSDCIVQDNSKSYENLAADEVLTDKGVLSLADNAALLQVGATYRVKIEDGEITKVYGKVREPITVTVKSMVGNIAYYDESGKEKSMTLPSSITYYYHGVKKDYASLSSLLLANMSIVFDYNDKVASSYAVITDAIYGKPQLALGFDPKLDKLGDIAFDSNTRIIKNGQPITKNDIKDRDVVYSITDINSNNRYILVVENYIEGNITALLADAYSSNGIQIDTVSYNYSDDMDISKLSSFSKGDLVSIILGHDGKVVDIRSMEEKTGSIAEYIILGNSKTSDKNSTTLDSLADNEILTNKGILTCKAGVAPLEIGGKYQLYINNNVITEIDKKENSVENYSVTSVAGSIIAYNDDNNIAKTMTLPKANLYYYHGISVDYEVAAKAVRAYSSIVLTKKSDNLGYDYVVIVDANFGKPQVYKADNAKLLDQIKNTRYSYIYRGANIQESQLNAYDVVYFVSDIWNKNTFIYVNDKVVLGTITAFTPDIINPTGLTINSVNYTFSKYFNKVRLNNYDGSIGNFITNVNVKDFKTLVLGVDGKIVDIY